MGRTGFSDGGPPGSTVVAGPVARATHLESRPGFRTSGAGAGFVG